MGLTVNTNLTAMSAANSLNSTQGQLSNTLARVSSGLRVTKAADDAAEVYGGDEPAKTNARSGKQAIRMRTTVSPSSRPPRVPRRRSSTSWTGCVS